MNAIHPIRAAGNGPDQPAGGAASSSHALPAGAVVLTLPMPPSVNEMFRNVPGRGRVKTADYLDWRGHAGWSLRGQRPASLNGPVVIVLSVERGSASADIDNRVKAIFDLLTEHDVIEDDKHVVGFCAAWAPPASKLARVMILPAASYPFQFQLASDRRSGGWYLDAPSTDQGEPHGP